MTLEINQRYRNAYKKMNIIVTKARVANSTTSEEESSLLIHL
jgi:hypothetical protein